MCTNLLEVKLLKNWLNFKHMMDGIQFAVSFRCMGELWSKECLILQETCKEFLLEVGFMCDALQELSELSWTCKSTTWTCIQRGSKDKSSCTNFLRWMISGPYEYATKAAKSIHFQRAPLHKRDCKNDSQLFWMLFKETWKISQKKEVW